VRKKSPVPFPRIIVDLEKITRNAAAVIKRCSAKGVSVYPVIKALAGFAPAIGAVMAASPAGILDSSFAGLEAAVEFSRSPEFRGNRHVPKTGIIRLPAVSEMRAIDRPPSVDYYFISEYAHIDVLLSRMKKFSAVIMVDTGDLREGVPLCELDGFVSGAARKKGLNIAGLATNHACFSGIVPTVSNLEQFAEKAVAVQKKHGLDFEIVSGGNSSLLGLILEGRTHRAINNVRIGEAILLGTDVISKNRIKWLHDDAFCVEAEVVEVRTREAACSGTRTQNAFGETVPIYAGRLRGGSARLQVLFNLGKRHFFVNGVKPLEKGLFVVGASSDYLIVDASEYPKKLECGSRVRFGLDYPALMSAMQVAGHNVAIEPSGSGR